MSTLHHCRKSPLLANSAFSGLDLWNSRSVFAADNITLNSPTLPTLHTSPVLSHYPRPRASSFDSDDSITSFGEREALEIAEEIKQEMIVPSVVSVAKGFFELGAPVAISKDTKKGRRSSLQLGKDVLLTWGKSHWDQDEDDESASRRLFGVSLQRNRRFQDPVPSPAHLSPESSSDYESALSTPGPETPMDSNSASTVLESPVLVLDNGESSNHTPVKLRGLGVSGVKGLEPIETGNAMIPKQNFSPFSFTLAVTPFGKPTASSSSSPSSPTKATSATQPLNTLGSPTTLAELRSLRIAATELETQVRQTSSRPTLPQASSSSQANTIAAPPIPPRRNQSAPHKTVSDMESISELPSRKIKRKAVPAFLQSAPQITPLQTPTGSFTETSASQQLVGHSYFDLASPVTTPEIGSESATPFSAFDRASPSFNQLPDTRRASPTRRGMYANSRATMSVMEISPRVASLPVHIPTRLSSNTQVPTRHQLEVMMPSQRNSVDAGSLTSASGSASSSDAAPETPTSSTTRIYGSTRKEAFMSLWDLSTFKNQDKVEKKAAPAIAQISKPSSVSNGFYASKGAFMSMLDLSVFSKSIPGKPPKETVEAKMGSKHKRVFSRLLGKK